MAPLASLPTLSTSSSACAARVQAGLPFSEAVARSAARGYAEPDVRDDLSGADMASKARDRLPCLRFCRESVPRVRWCQGVVGR